MDSILGQLQSALTPIALAAFTAFLGWLFTILRSYFHVATADSAEAAVRTAAVTEAGKLAATIPAATVAAIATAPSTSVASLFSPADIKTAASKIITDLPQEIKLTGYTPTDIFDMILGNLPSILGAVNPALGTIATIVKNVAIK
jgi:hypothetical protein